MAQSYAGMRGLTREARWCLVALYVVAFFTFGLTVARHLGSPLRFDEVEWPIQARGILQHGVPKVLYSEENILYTQSYYGYDAHYGMWHPPLYLYSLAGSAALFGTGNVPMRAVGLIWFILSLWLGWRVVNILSDDGDSKRIRGIPLALALLTPLLAEGSLYLDIDNTSLAFSTLLFAWVFLRSPEEKSLKRILLLGVVFAFSLCSKFTTPFIALASVVLFHSLNGNFKSGIAQGIAIGGLGAGLFILMYWTYCRLFNYPPWFMFDISYWGKRGMYLSPHALKAMLHSVRWNFVWVSPPIALMLMTVFCLRLWNYVCCHRLDKVDFLLIFSVLGLGTYALWGGMLGKYTFPPVLAGVIAVGSQMPNYLKSLRITNRVMFLTLLLTLTILHLVAVPALQVRLPGFDVRAAGLWQAISDVRNLYLFTTVTAFLVFFAIARQFMAGQKRETAVLASLLMYLLVANPINTMKLVLSPDDRSPYHPFQERGFVQTVQFLNETLGQNDIILSPKDIGYYFHGKHYSTEAVLAFDGLPALRELALSPKIRYVVDSEKYPTIPDHNSVLGAASAFTMRRIGDFRAFQYLGAGH